VSGTPAAAILAGGLARRFGGVAKGLEVVGGARIVDRLVSALREVTSEILLVGAPEAIAAELPALRAVPDESPGNGPLGGIISALAASGRDTVVVAWDMPFVTATELRPLLDAVRDAEVVAWEVNARVEPLCALYRAAALPALRGAYQAGERSPRDALRGLRVHLVRRDASGALDPFTSVNSAQQLEAARQAFAAAQH
jgi:molybdopterin-guanine dinucleotide biosynthesis protein A